MPLPRIYGPFCRAGGSCGTAEDGSEGERAAWPKREQGEPGWALAPRNGVQGWGAGAFPAPGTGMLPSPSEALRQLCLFPGGVLGSDPWCPAWL